MKEEEITVKLLIPYHKPCELLKSEVFIPVHTGRKCFIDKYKTGLIDEKNYQWMMNNMIGDDTGENISHLDKKLCECTVMYWAWKNYSEIESPDYIGFMHYRRHFLFNDINDYFSNYKDCVAVFDRMDEDYLYRIGYSNEKIKNLLSENDFICINPVDDGCTIYEHYKQHHIIEELDYCIALVREKYPDLAEEMDTYFNQKNGYYCDMFIMKKELFFKYCEFVFDIGLDFVNQVDYTYYSSDDSRAYVVERLTGFYLYHLMQDKSLKYKTLPISFVENVDIVEEIKPAFENNNVPIIFTADTDYVKFAGIAIQSIMDNSSEENNYDIFLISAEIEDNDKAILNRMVKNKKNFSLRYLNIKNYLHTQGIDASIIYDGSRFSGGTFYRLWIPTIFKNYDKVIYLDPDLVVLDDIKKLYDIDLSNSMIGGTRDTEWIRVLYRKHVQSKFLWKYVFEKLELKKPYDYIQAGVLIFNIPLMIENQFFENCFKKLEELGKAFNNDQDLINYVCQDKIKYFENNWNVEWHCTFFNDDLNKSLPEETYKNYMEARKNPKILHYSSVFKPWKEPTRDLAYYFWEYAKKTPFYEQVLYENILKPFSKTGSDKENPENISIIKLFNTFPVLTIKKIRRMTYYTKYIYLFDKILLLRIKAFTYRKIFYLFGFFPLMKVKNFVNRIMFYLFGLIPILRIKKKVKICK